MTGGRGRLLGVNETAEILGCSRSHMKKGYGPKPVRLGPRRIRAFWQSDVDAFIWTNSSTTSESER